MKDEVYHHETSLTKNAKGNYLSWNKRMINNNMKTYASIKLTGKNKYIIKFEIL